MTADLPHVCESCGARYYGEAAADGCCADATSE